MAARKGRGRLENDVDGWLSAGVPLNPGTIKDWVPHPLNDKQREFLALPHFEALYGGAAGGGKSDALLADALQFVHVGNYKALILRRTFRALNLPDSIMHRAMAWIGREWWNDIDKRFTFPSGAILQFGYCDNEADLDRYKSAQFHRIYIDELTEWPERWATFLFSRIRRVRGDAIPLAMRAATNPDGLGAEWVRTRFGIPEGEIPVGLIEAAADRAFLPARIEDNPALDIASYEQALSKLGPIRYQQLRFGRWLRDGEGLVYAHFDSKKNETIVQVSLDYYLLGIDFGFTDATAFCILGWREHDTTVYVERCWKETGLTPTDVAEKVTELMKAYDFTRIIGDTGGLGKGYAEEMRARWHIPIEPAAKENKRGYIDLINGAFSRAQLILCMPECEELRAELIVLPWHENRQKEADGAENHCTDSLLYTWRAATAYIEKPGPRQLIPGTKEWEEAAAEERREKMRREEEKKSRASDGWNRPRVENFERPWRK